MRNGNLIVGLDVGTTKTCAVVGVYSKGSIDIVSIGSSPSAGLRKGMVINVESTVDSIRAAVREAEAMAGVRIKKVNVGITGEHIKGFQSYGAVGVKGGEVLRRDVENVIESAGAVYVPLDREVLHVIPTDFILDGNAGINDPLGMAGVRLEAKVHIITASSASVQTLIKCCEKAGLDVAEVVFEPIASGASVLTDDEKALGVVLVDIGGGTTDIAVYRDSSLLHTAVLSVGGNHFTNDIAVGLRLPVSEAERVKREHGYAVTDMALNSGDINITGADRQVRKVPERDIAEIIEPRCGELMNLIKGELGQCKELASMGMVMTGGASLLKGIDRVAGTVIGMPVRTGVPEDTGGLGNIVSNPVYSTSVGLLMQNPEAVHEGVRHSGVLTEKLNSAKEWIKGLLNKKGGGTLCLNWKK